MSLPFENPDTTFDSFLQELPADYHERAIEFKAFTRSRKIKTPAHLMQVVMCYCGLDEVLREVAGNFTLLAEQISDTAIHHRLKACVPWVKALLTGMMGEAVKPLLEGRLRILVADGSTVQGPGASGIQYRLHIAIDLVRLHLVHVVVTDEHTAESLTHYPLQDGDVAMTDRGYNQVAMWMEIADRGVGLIVRYNPHGLHFHDAAGKIIDLERQLKEATAPAVCVPAQVRNQKKQWLNLDSRQLRMARPAGERGLPCTGSEPP